jgi:hypothetical protein
MRDWKWPAATGAMLLCALHANAGAREPERFQCLAEAYPGYVKGLRFDPATRHYSVDLSDGRALPWDDGTINKTPEQRLASPDLEDTLANPYPAGGTPRAPGADDDPGRVRLAAFFDGIYGGSEREVRSRLEEVDWLPRHSGKRLLFNGRNGAAAALRRVSAELEKLPGALHRYFTVTAGTFNWRTIAGTDRASAHSYGIAVDINVQFSDYWRWNAKGGAPPVYRNRIPVEVVSAFERHGFIWGGKWHHYDTMHFEYRPELLHPRCVRGAPTMESKT